MNKLFMFLTNKDVISCWQRANTFFFKDPEVCGRSKARHEANATMCWSYRYSVPLDLQPLNYNVYKLNVIFSFCESILTAESILSGEM